MSRDRIIVVFALIIATIAALMALIAVAVGDEETQTFDAVVAEDRKDDDFRNDLGDRGESAGDVIGQVDPLQRDGEGSGTSVSLCTLTGSEENQKAACTTTLDFPEGSLITEGIFDIARRDEAQEFAILGGTGDYGGARGTVTVEPGGEDRFLLSVDVATED